MKDDSKLHFDLMQGINKFSDLLFFEILRLFLNFEKRSNIGIVQRL